MNNDIKKIIDNDGEINLYILIEELWNKKLFITSITTLAAIISVLYALSLPNIYRSQALLASTDSNSSSISSSLGGLSSLAGMAGISLPSGGSDAKKNESLAILNSYQFLESFIISHNIMVPIMASTGIDKNTNRLIINPKIYDVNSEKWVTKNGKELKPSIQETVRTFRAMFRTSLDKRTGYVSIIVDTYSPQISQKWVQWLIDDINIHVMNDDLNRAEKSLGYLNNQINQTNITEIKSVISQLIKSEIQKIMLSKSSPDYVFKIIDKPIAPELKLSPKRSVICILGTVIGFILAFISALALIFFNQKKIQ